MSDSTHLDTVRRQHFPMMLPDGIVAKPVTLDTFFDIQDRLFDDIFTNGGHPNWFSTPADRRANGAYLGGLQRLTHQEAIAFCTGDNPETSEPVGWSAGRMTSASDYLMDETGILPAYRGRGIYSAFLSRYLVYLRDLGYERVVSYHAPNNRAVLIAKLRAGFVITGMRMRADSGASVQLTYFTHDDRRHAFDNAVSLEPDFTRS